METKTRIKSRNRGKDITREDIEKEISVLLQRGQEKYQASQALLPKKKQRVGGLMVIVVDDDFFKFPKLCLDYVEATGNPIHIFCSDDSAHCASLSKFEWNKF